MIVISRVTGESLDGNGSCQISCIDDGHALRGKYSTKWFSGVVGSKYWTSVSGTSIIQLIQYLAIAQDLVLKYLPS